MAPLLSIIVGTRDRESGYRAMLESIDRNTLGVDWELLVEDVSDRPGYVLSRGDQIRAFRHDHPDGHIKGYNRMFRQARGEWVTWLNDDAVVMPDWARVAINWMQNRPQVGLGCLTWKDAEGPWHVSVFVDLPYANFGILRRQTGDRLDWFDEDLRFYGGDNSLAFRVMLDGLGCIGIPGEFVHHFRTADRHRPHNEATQPVDHQKMLEKYMPKLGQMIAANSRVETELRKLRLLS